MKFLFLLVALVAFVAANTIPHHEQHQRKVVKDKQSLMRQKNILELYDRVNQKSYRQEHEEIAKSFNLEEYAKENPEAEEYLEYHKYNPIKRGEIVSVYYEPHLKQAIALFKLFYHAKDYDTFYKIAVWARNHVNQGLFVYSLTVAIVHRADTKDIVLPPIYEIAPYYFFPTEVIYKAQYYKQMHDQEEMDKHDPEYEGYTIDANYSGHYLNLHEGQSLSYYLEDIGLNAVNYYYQIQNPSWMNTEEYGLKYKNRGAVAYYRIQQTLARYYLERLANKWGEIPLLDWDVPVETPYTPSLVYPNGLEFPSRPKFANLHEYFYTYRQKYTTNKYSYSYYYVKDLERRIEDVADSRYVLTHDGKIEKLDTETQEGLNILGNIIDGNNDSIYSEFYGGMKEYSRHLLGYSMLPLNEHQLVPSALEHYSTAGRDPVVYQLYKKYLMYFRRYFKHVHPYTKKDLAVPGLEIMDAKVDDLITYMDHYYTDISNAVFYGPQEKRADYQVRVRQQRLNHKPFGIKLNVKSDKDQKVAVKVFLGPKYDEYERYLNMTENHLNFVELDHYVYELKAGENVVERNSHEFIHWAPDRVSGVKLYQQVQKAIEENGEFSVDKRQDGYNRPHRFMLPKGSEEGTVYQLFFYVYPFTSSGDAKEEYVHLVHEDKPYGYPLERHVKYDGVYHVPNAHFHEVKIYHQDLYEINVPHHHHEH